MLGILATAVFTVAVEGICVFDAFRSEADNIIAKEIIKEDETADKNIFIEMDSPVRANLLVDKDKEIHIAEINLSVGIDGNKEDIEIILANMNSRITTVRDIINCILRKKTFEELKKADGIKNLKNEILNELRKEFNSNLISEIYVNDFFIQ